ncbi:MAG TPA: HlyD family efflux transporter periplasmic adaptor subunit [Gemmataceae bacterium]|jgi:multidrug resistance efflux pump
MWKQFVIPLIALGSLAFATTHIIRSQQPPAVKEPLVEPPRSPFARTVAGAGIVEARSDASNTANISVGSELAGVVAAVRVKVGQRVKAGEPLFELDDRQLRAELGYREANLAAAKAQLLRLEQMPRPEEVPPSEAKTREAEANVRLQADQLARAEKLVGSHSIGEEDWVARKQGLAAAEAQLAQARANLALLKAGAWDADKAVARAAVAQAEAQVGQTRTDLDRRIARAPVAATVLQVNLRPGEFVGTPPNQPLVVLGDTDQLHVRVDVDENDIHRFRPGMRAVAKLRGDPRRVFPLTFVRVEPYVVPKKALTGDNTERVDTRVLQVIYAIDPQSTTLYVGQQVDVFLADE